MIRKRVISTLSTILLLTGCNTIEPKFEALKADNIPKEWKQNHSKDSHYVVNWWREFHSHKLNILIKKAYEQNLDIKSASMRILQARAMLGVANSLKLPQLQTLSGAISKTHTTLLDVDANILNFDMGWELDIWGKYASGIDASLAQLYASISSYDQIVVSILAEVAKNYIIYSTLQERILYASRNLVIQKRVVNMTKVQFKAGNVSQLDMTQALTQLHNTQTSIYALKIAKIKVKNALAFLVGENSRDIENILYKKEIKKLEKESNFLAKNRNIIKITNRYINSLDTNIIPKATINPYYKIDANLITQRADVKVAEHIVHANYSLINVERSKLYPSFSLFGNIGYNANNKFGTWIGGSDALSVTIGPSFSWNIFDYGRIKNQIRVQDAKFEESLFNYNKQVLLAVSEVSSAFESYQLTLKELQSSKKALKSSIRAFNLSILQYNEGLISYQRVLIALEKLTISQDRYTSIKGDLALNAIAIYKALGGGWQISRDRAYISKELAQKMKKRTDWGNYLDTNMTIIPKELYDKK